MSGALQQRSFERVRTRDRIRGNFALRDDVAFVPRARIRSVLLSLTM